MNGTVLAEPIPFRVLIDEAMKLTRRYFRVMYLPVAIPLAVLTGAIVVAESIWLQEIASGGVASPFSTGGCLVMWASILVSMIVHGLTSALLTSAATDGAANRPVDMRSKWSFVLQPSVLGTLLLTFLAILAGFVALLVPGIFLIFGLSFVVPVMAVESLRGTAAMGRSWRLVRYNPHKRFLDNPASKIFLLFLIGFLISYTVAFLIQLPLTIMSGLAMARNISSGASPNMRDVYASMRWTQAISAILSSLVSTAVSVYTSFGVALLYYDVVRRKEGTDLAAALDARFGAPPAVDYGPPPAPLPPPADPTA